MDALFWLFRLSMAGTYIGHGAFGILTKQAWVPYITLFGFSEADAWRLMPWIGAMDVSLGLLALFSPRRFVMAHLVFWGTFTALLRPLSGQGWWEFFERAGNWGIALAFLLAVGRGRTLGEWVERVREIRLTSDSIRTIAAVLRATTVLLLIGHGGFGAFMHKPMLAEHFAAVGLHAPVVEVTGWLEITLGVAILVKPLPQLLAFACIWKIATELLYPAAGAPMWEFIERAGSFAAPFGLIICGLVGRGPVTSGADLAAFSAVFEPEALAHGRAAPEP